MTLIDRLGEALAAATESAFRQKLGPEEWRGHMARAALEAMREPTEAMREAGAEVVRHVGAEQDPATYEGDAANVWRLMVDAASEEGPGQL